jgi:serine/threonine protein kinase
VNAPRTRLDDDLRALVGQVIGGRYRVDAVLGFGGMGAVFRAHHLGLRRDVAVKVLHPDIGLDRRASMRFDREAQSASRLDHPNCVRVTDFGSTKNGIKYLVMELLEGTELKEMLDAPMRPARVVDIALQVLEGLAHAHHQGLVHRDLKPENIFITQNYRGQEVVKLVDFGIAKILDASDQERLTRTGFVFGTPSFMSPEQALGNPVDERTDLYAVGLVLYQLLAGQRPFVSTERAELMRMQIMVPPPPLPGTIPPELSAVVMKLLQKQPDERFPNALAVVEQLTHIRPRIEHAPVAPNPGMSQVDTGAMTAAFDEFDDEDAPTRVRTGKDPVPEPAKAPMMSWADGRVSTLHPASSQSAPPPGSSGSYVAPQHAAPPASSSSSHPSASVAGTSAHAGPQPTYRPQDLSGPHAPVPAPRREGGVIKFIVAACVLVWLGIGAWFALTMF